MSRSCGARRPQDKDGYAVILRDYQQEAVRFIRSAHNATNMRRRVRCLFDDPGLGKTPVACVSMGAADHPELLLCPAGLIDTWREHLAVWAPQFRVFVPKTSFDIRAPEIGEVVIISIDLLATLRPRVIRSTDPAKLERAAKQQEQRNIAACRLRMIHPGTCMTVDEVQGVKSAASARSLAFEDLWKKSVRPKGGILRVLSGTPDPNSLLDLWVILECCGIAEFVFRGGIVGFAEYAQGSWSSFERRWKFADKPIGPIRELEGIGEFVLRRVQDEVLGELPEPNVIVTTVRTPNNIASMADDLLRWAVASIAANTPVERREDAIVEVLTGAKGVALGDLSKFRKQIAEHKIPVMQTRLMELELVGTGVIGNPIVVYSDHLPPIDALRGRKGWATLRGGDSRKARTDAVLALREGRIEGLGMTGAGRVGYTLIESAYMLKLSPSWSWDDELQAERRLIRFGQKRVVTIETIVLDHEIERMVLRVLQRKKIRSTSTWAPVRSAA
jgi:SNF2 family DNA or RNA helicase